MGSELLEAAFAVCKVEVGGAGVPAWMKEYRLHSKAKKGYQKQLVVYGHEMVFQTLDHNQAVAEGLFTTHKVHAHTHTHAHAHAHARARARARARTYIRMHARTHARTLAATPVTGSRHHP